MKTGWRLAYTLVLIAVGGVEIARADVTGSYDGTITGKKIPTPVKAAASLSAAGTFLTGTVALEGDPGAVSGAYLVSGKATPKKVMVKGGNPSGALLKWKGKIVGGTLQGKATVKGPGVKLAGTMALTLNVATGDGSACDAVYTQNTTLFNTLLAGPLTPCTTCHVAGGQASATRFRITAGNPLATARTVAMLVDSADPAASRIIAKPTGLLPHGGGTQITAGSADAQSLLQWVTLVAQAHCN
jgi:hypothetical protein